VRHDNQQSAFVVAIPCDNNPSLAQNKNNCAAEAQDQATEWLWTYNNERPNMGIGGMTPAKKNKSSRVNSTAEPH